LFLVTFDGSEFDEESPIYDLIVNYHVGGVVLTTANDNFVAAPDTVLAAYELVDALQTIEWRHSVNTADPNIPSIYIPLWVGIAQEGGGPPNDEIFSGLTTLPDQMAIGATWNPLIANRAGEVMGRRT
jgi:beta-N-acetylhexosaminidase